MRVFTAAFLAGLLAPATAASIANGQASSVFPRGDDLKIPGDSPLELCPGDHTLDLVEINRVDLSPNPPKP